MITETFKVHEERILSRLGISYSGLSLCELGNQSYAGQAAKKMYEAKGVRHTSIDINGRSGALPLNLDVDIPSTLENSFDVVTNYGTSEHVNNQYAVFKNIHAMGRASCIMFHGVPLVGHWKKHCRYYYSKQFFVALAKICRYTIIDFTIVNTGFYKKPKNLVSCVFRKETSLPFVSQKQFFCIPGLVDSGYMVKTGNYA